MMKQMIECLGCFALGGFLASWWLIARLRPKDLNALSFREKKRYAKFFCSTAVMEKVQDVERALRKLYGSCLASAILERVRVGGIPALEVGNVMRKVQEEQTDLLDEAERLYQVRLRTKHGNIFE
jgi:hypothetical protein